MGNFALRKVEFQVDRTQKHGHKDTWTNGHMDTQRHGLTNIRTCVAVFAAKKLKSILLIHALDEALSILSAPRNPKKLTRQLSLPNDKANLEGRSHFQQFGTFLAPPKPNKRNVGLFRKGIRYLHISFCLNQSWEK